MSKHPNDHASMDARGWPERGYQCVCLTCDQYFHGYKRDMECRLCEETRVNRIQAAAQATIAEFASIPPDGAKGPSSPPDIYTTGKLYLDGSPGRVTVTNIEHPTIKTMSDEELDAKIETWKSNDRIVTISVPGKPNYSPKSLSRRAYERWARDQPEPQRIPWEKLDNALQTLWRVIVGELLIEAAPIMSDEIRKLQVENDQLRARLEGDLGCQLKN